MKKQYVVLGIVCMIVCHYVFCEEVIDGIVAIVSSSVGTELITTSDLNRPTLFGNFRTLEECELEKGILLEAAKYQIHVDDAMVEAYFDSVQKAEGITRQEIQQMWIDIGYTDSEGIEQFRNSQIINIMLQREVYEHISVSLQEVQHFYDEHPEYYEATYMVKRAIVKTEEESPQFSSPVVLKESELATTHYFIRELRKGETHSIQHEDTTEIIRLLEKTERILIPLAERYDTIARILKQQKYATLFEQYKQKVLGSVTIIRM